MLSLNNIICIGEFKLVVDIGYDPIRCSPSDHSPGLIRPSRSPELSTIDIEIGLRNEVQIL